MNELLNKMLQKNKTLCIHEIILNLIETLVFMCKLTSTNNTMPNSAILPPTAFSSNAWHYIALLISIPGFRLLSVSLVISIGLTLK